MYKNIQFKNGLMIYIWECLSEIFQWKKFNWNTWQFIDIEFENDRYTGTYSFTFVLMCCGISIHIPHETEKSKKFWKLIKRNDNILTKSCYGYTSAKSYKTFKENHHKFLIILNKPDKQHRKKLFIQ